MSTVLVYTYRVVTDHSLESLSRQIGGFKAQGWSLVGGVSVAFNPILEVMIFAQAIEGTIEVEVTE